MDIVANFDPSVVPIPNVNAQMTRNGKIVFYNESNIGLLLTFADGVTDILAPWTAQVYCLGDMPSPQIQVQALYTLASGVSPVSKVIAIRYQPSEKVHGTFPIALARQVNANVSATTSVQNDGSAGQTVFVEATQAGNIAGSNVLIRNDGTASFRQWVSSTLTEIFRVVTGTPTPANTVPNNPPAFIIGPGAALSMIDGNGNLNPALSLDQGTNPNQGNLTFTMPLFNNSMVYQDKTGIPIFFIDGKNLGLVLAPNAYLSINDPSFNIGKALQCDPTTKNTDLIAHPTGNKVDILDKNLNVLLRISGRNTTVQAGDSNSVLSNVFGIDSSNNTFIQSHATNNQTVVYDKNGNAIATFDANKLMNMAGVKQTANGDTSGTMDVYEFLSGAIKFVVLIQTNYRQNGATGNLITLKTAFSTVAMILNMGCGGVVTATGGTVATNRQITWGTGTAAGTQANNAQIPQDAAGFTVAGFTQVGDAGSYAAAHGGIAIYAGT